MRYVYATCVASLFFLAVSNAAAQVGSMRGELSCERCRGFSNVTITIEDSNRFPVGSFPVAPNGAFEMYGVREGNYMLTVRNASGDTLHTEFVSIRDHTGPLSIRMPQDRNTTPAQITGMATVSVAQLRHKVPKNAWKEFQKAEKRGMRAKHTDESIAHLEKAVELDPEFLEAVNNLGTLYMQTERPEKALEAFRRAAELDPFSAVIQTNVAVALMAMREFTEAEHCARRAMEMQNADVKTRYILGLSLYAQRKFSEETIRLLEQTESRFPNAGIAVANILAARGQVVDARQKLRTYLASGQTERRAQVQAMLSSLK